MNNKQDKSTDYLIIGSGISGLCAAQQIHQNGKDVLLIDKSRGVGGRMATRRVDNYHFDHGAQSMEWNTELLPGLFDQAVQKQLLMQTSYSKHSRSNDTSWYGINGMTTWPKLLSKNLNIILKSRITAIKYNNNNWYVENQDGLMLRSKKLILTLPIPQSIELIDTSELSIQQTTYDSLKAVSYDPVIVLLITYNVSDIVLKEKIKRTDSEKIELLVDNFAKGVSKYPGAVTVAATVEFSKKYYHSSEKTIEKELLGELRKSIDIKPESVTVHKWRFAHVNNNHTKTYECLESPLPLGFAGDGFNHSGIIGAAKSGLMLAQKMIYLYG